MNDPHLERYSYHEAGHVVAAAVLGFPLRSSGVHVDSDGLGTTLILCPPRACSRAFSDLEAKQKGMVIVLLAGLLAQKKFCRDSSANSARDDDLKVRQYLGAIYRTNETAILVARRYLEQEANRLVNAHWPTIQHVAESLWAKPCTRVIEPWDTASQFEKTLGAAEIGEILTRFNISLTVDDSASEDGLTGIAD